MSINKIIFIDWGSVIHRAIYSRNTQLQKTNGEGFIPPSTYTACSIMISNLKKIGLKKEDKVIIACDSKTNWRKEIDPCLDENPEVLTQNGRENIKE